MKYKFLCLVGVVVLVAASVWLTHLNGLRTQESILNLADITSDVNEIQAVVSVLSYGENRMDNKIFEEIDCNVYVTFNEKIRTIQYQISDNYYFMKDKDKETAERLIEHASKSLKNYISRSGEKNCAQSEAILGLL